MQETLDIQDRKLVTIIDPHIKISETYKVHIEASKGDFYVKNKDGNSFRGECWPGMSS